MVDKNNISENIIQITYQNNGIAFEPEDWNELEEIAEGNPDEQKVDLSISYLDSYLSVFLSQD